MSIEIFHVSMQAKVESDGALFAALRLLSAVDPGRVRRVDEGETYGGWDPWN